MTRIVSIGECMIELAPAAEEGTYGMAFGGDTFNTAWYLARLQPDWAVDYLTAIGRDKVSDKFADFVAASGIGTGLIQRDADRSMGLYLIELDQGERSFSYWRDTAAARHLAADQDRVEEGCDGADLIFLSGITLAILPEADRAKLFDALGEAQAGGAIVAFDPNIRPRLWPDPEEMRGALMEAALSADQILPSFDEESEHFGDATPTDTIKRYMAAGVTSVIVKNGPGRIHYCCDGQTGHVDPTPASAVVDTTAAGDSFNAGYIAALLSGQNPEQAIATACAVSGRVIQHKGALVTAVGSVAQITP